MCYELGFAGLIDLLDRPLDHEEKLNFCHLNFAIAAVKVGLEGGGPKIARAIFTA